jgi:hypothetical protein
MYYKHKMEQRVKSWIMLTRIIKEVPDNLFFAAKQEIDQINFDQIQDPRSKASVFNSSTAIHLRIHKPPTDGPMPASINEWSVITECVDHPVNYDRFPQTIKLSEWIYQQVNGIEIGRIMIIRLKSKGVVAPHIDPLDYFEQFSRFHIPFKTTPEVVFNDGKGSADEHMPYKMLCRLNNRLLHGLYNGSQENRIHLLVDIRQPGGNQIF